MLRIELRAVHKQLFCCVDPVASQLMSAFLSWIWLSWLSEAGNCPPGRILRRRLFDLHNGRELREDAVGPSPK